jgi:hypothetical protein
MQFLIDIALTFFYLCGFLLLLAWTYRFWKLYVYQRFLNKSSEDAILLEIKLPREIMKSPLATEVALASMLQGSGLGKPFFREFVGNLPITSSLEIASIEGVIHFYVRVDKKFKTLVESNFYAQYPGIEIVQTDDYTSMIRYHHLSKDTAMWGGSYLLSEEWTPTNPKTGEPYKGAKDAPVKLPADFLPIRTYVDFGLDKDPKEEYKTDPITTLIEFMGSIGKGEYFWYQVVIQDAGVYNGEKMPKLYENPAATDPKEKHLTIKEMADRRKKQIRTASWKVKGQIAKNEFGVPTIIKAFNDKGEQQFRIEKDENGKITKIPIEVPATYLETKSEGKKEMELTMEEKDELEAINKKMSKPLAAAVVRLVYVAKSEHQKIGQQVHNILGFGKPYKGINSFKYGKLSDPYEYPWQKPRHMTWRAEEVFEAFVEREAFLHFIPERKGLDSWEDLFFWASNMKSRKTFRMLVEAIFHPFESPHPGGASVLNVEELATLWHLPGAVAATPTLPRIDSNKGMAPSNLPQ